MRWGQLSRNREPFALVDVFTILVSHAVLLLALWRLMQRADLDSDGPAEATRPRPWLKPRADPDA